MGNFKAVKTMYTKHTKETSNFTAKKSVERAIDILEYNDHKLVSFLEENYRLNISVQKTEFTVFPKPSKNKLFKDKEIKF